jgi:hypothetical protein
MRFERASTMLCIPLVETFPTDRAEMPDWRMLTFVEIAETC